MAYMSQAARFDDEAAVSPYRRVYELSPEKLEATKPSSRVRREVDLRDVWRVLVKHRATIFGVLLGTVVTTAFVVLTLPPYYTATATVQIERQAPKIAPIADLDEAEPLAVDKYDYYQTQYNVLHSRTVAARVIRGLRLDRDGRFISQEPTFLSSLKERFHDWFQSAAAIERLRSPMGVDPELIDDYLDMLSVTPVRNSRLVDVSFTSRFPDLSVEVAARHVEEYVNANLEQRVGMTAKAKELLDTELAKAKDRVVAAEVTLNDFRKAKGVVSLDGGISDIVTTRLG
ncbi:MAG: polysaccharide biosynthesis transport protein, partial [Candidatus Binatota bacterium]|nr:polysaccharide biosynthesis transport protein [Candidatus Binatota bacterium]